MMEELKSLIQQVDDDYLIGLSNKGIVKRAYKDFGQETPNIVWKEKDIQVSLKEETCVIKNPLGESACSCPSKNICRHIMTAILWIKESLKEDKVKIEDIKTDKAETEHKENEIEQVQIEKKENETEKVQTKSEENETKQKQIKKQVIEKETDNSKNIFVLKEVLKFPLEKLKRVCGVNRYRQFLARFKAGEAIPMEESSIVVIKFPWENITVKLLEPFAYSACSCHSKELCVHKAQAILFYQFQKGKITLQQLDDLLEEKTFDEELIKQTCGQICEKVSEQICTGLSRQSKEVSDELEWLAVMAHRAELPQLESWLREGATMYHQYFSRTALFRSEELLRKLLQIYKRSKKLLHTDSQKEIGDLAGNFRDSYKLVGKLHLMGIGSRIFHSKTGYEGQIYYFLEMEQKKWYTWTDARPVFYEDVRRRPTYILENTSAPWGLLCNQEQMMELEFELNHAKVAFGGRLSVSQETKGTIIRSRDLLNETFTSMIVWNYETLAEQLLDEQKEKLTLIGAVDWGATFFDKIGQQFFWKLYDKEGRTLFISLKYTKEDKMLIHMLERLEKRLKNYEKKEIFFFGLLYLDEEKRICLYPIEFFQMQETLLKKEEENLQNLEETKRESLQDLEEREVKQEDLQNLEISKRDKLKLPSISVLQRMEQYEKEVVNELNNLFISGIYSMQDGVIQHLEQLGEEGEQLGLHQAGRNLTTISQLLKEKRHQITFKLEPVIEEMANLEPYLYICRQKISVDKAILAMREEKIS